MFLAREPLLLGGGHDLAVAHDRSRADPVDAEDADLGVVDERRHDEPGQLARARDREGGAAQVLGREPAGARLLRDRETGSLWSWLTGEAVEGELKGTRLGSVSHNPILVERFKAFYEEGCNASACVPMLTLNTGICGDLMMLMRLLDDRGQVLVRHGEPSDRATFQEPGVEPNESWRYPRDGEDIVLHFVALMIFMYAVASPYYKRLRTIAGAMVEGSQAVGEERLAELLIGPRAVILAVGGMLGLLFILYLMFFKPF